MDINIILTSLGAYITYISLLILSRRLFGAGVRLLPCCISSTSLFAAYLLTMRFFLPAGIVLVPVAFFVPATAAAYISLTKIRLRTVLYEYIVLHLITVILVSASTADNMVDTVPELLCGSLSCILLLAGCIFAGYSRLRHRIRYSLRLTPQPIKSITLLLLFCCAFLSVSILKKPFYDHPVWSDSVKLTFIFLLVIMTLIIICLVIYSTSDRHFRRLTQRYERQIEKQTEHYSRLSESYFRMRRLRHDLKNMSIGLNDLLEEGKCAEALEMLRSVQQELSAAAPLFDTGNRIADAIFAEKALRAQSSDIVIEFDGALPTEGIKPRDLCVILGDTLDNSIEACEKINTDEKKTIKISCICSSGFLFIEITNPVAERVAFENGMPVSGRKNSDDVHGIGLYSVELAVSHYHGEMSFACDESEFKITVSLALAPRENAKK